MAQAFKHNFKTPLGVIDVNGIHGYNQCLKEVLDYLLKVTKSNPEKRFIDAADLSEKIEATANELTFLELEAKGELSIKPIDYFAAASMSDNQLKTHLKNIQ